MNTLFRPIAFSLSLLATAAQADVPLPVKVLTGNDLLTLPAVWLEPGPSQPFRFASAVRTSAYNLGNNDWKVQRSTSGNAAVHQSLPAANPPLLPTWPTGSSVFDFKVQHDHAQAWATMSSTGVPWIWLRGFGDYKAEAVSSWNTTVTVPAGGLREVIVRFVLPPATVSGVTEQQGPNAWRARLRAELLVNGFPAWSTEALRFHTSASGGTSKPLLQQFGNALFFPTNDEDASTTNDSEDGMNGASTKTTVHLSLGLFSPGSVIELSMIHRANVFSQPTSGGSHRCKHDTYPVDDWFCSGSGITINGSTGEAPRIYLKN
ncbi:MAG: hypothetical protein JNM08_08545 [Rubrivivax sp.]|nr:hypothetical protein [Rubrivivax sp.]